MSGCRPSVTGYRSWCDSKQAVCRSAGEMLREAMEGPAGSLLTDVDGSLDTSQIWGRVVTWWRCLHEIEEAL